MVLELGLRNKYQTSPVQHSWWRHFTG